MDFKRSEIMDQLPKQYFAHLVKTVNELKNTGADIINLGQGNPDQPTPSHIVDSMKSAVEKYENHRYPPFRGHSYVKEAAASFYQQQFGVELDPEKEVCVLFGGKGGLVEVSQCLLNKGDTALVPDPGYPDYWSGVALAGGKMEMMPLIKENHFLPDFTEVSAESLKKGKLMFLNYPNNPTGAAAIKSFLKKQSRLPGSMTCVWYMILPMEV